MSPTTTQQRTSIALTHSRCPPFHVHSTHPDTCHLSILSPERPLPLPQHQVEVEVEVGRLRKGDVAREPEGPIKARDRSGQVLRLPPRLLGLAP